MPRPDAISSRASALPASPILSSFRSDRPPPRRATIPTRCARWREPERPTPLPSLVVWLSLLHERARALLRILGLHHLARNLVFDFEGLLVWTARGSPHGLLDLAHRQRTVLRDRCRQFLRLRDQFLLRHHVVNQAQPPRFLRIDPIAGQQDLHRLAVRNLALEPRQRSGRRDDRPLHLLQPEARVLRRDAKVGALDE